MTLQDAIAAFRSASGLDATSPDNHQQPVRSNDAIDIFGRYASTCTELTEVTPYLVRDFLGRWCIEAASRLPADESISPPALIGLLADFFRWADHNTGTQLSDQCSPVLKDLELSLPRALALGRAIQECSAQRGGPFSFPEFLTSFEDGGHSEYDVGDGGQPLALEGYFSVVRVEACQIEVDDVISGETIWPILLPEPIARLVLPGYILNLEIIRVRGGWQIVDCGLAYPPGVEVI
ncbi:MAG TPA: hypothetical protein VJH03_08430 [Blastocatellia bacterium]|nr:hypothetical protein [Blastocatellia bacterium]